MGRSPRIDVGGEYYHVLNRSNHKLQIFNTPHDYRTFIEILNETAFMFQVQILGFCIMPNHWHIIVQTVADGDLSKFMRRLTNTHVKRYQSEYEIVGNGRLYKGRYKSFVINDDLYFYTVLRYVERNALKANLVDKAEEWQWGSAFLRTHHQTKFILATPPINLGTEYLSQLNSPLTEGEEQAVKISVDKSSG